MDLLGVTGNCVQILSAEELAQLWVNATVCRQCDCSSSGHLASCVASIVCQRAMPVIRHLAALLSPQLRAVAHIARALAAEVATQCVASVALQNLAHCLPCLAFP